MSNMSRESEQSFEELIHFILSVDRRIFVIREFQHRSILQASDVAKEVGRSLQNISRALKELKKEGIVVSITPEKRTWKRYVLSEKGKKVLIKLKEKGLL